MATSSERTLVGVCDEEMPDSYATSWQCSKLGGNPDWMYPGSNYPACVVCGDPMYHVAQLYCPLEALPYHRTIYIFTCVKKTCMNRRESWRVFRCQLPVTSPPSKGTKQVIQTIPKEVTLATDEWCEDADDWGSESEEESQSEQISSSTTNLGPSQKSVESLMEFQHNRTISLQTVCVNDVTIHNKSDGDISQQDSVAMVTHSSAETLEETTENYEVPTEINTVCESCSLTDNSFLACRFGQTDADKMAHHMLDERTSKTVDPSDAMQKLSITMETADKKSSNDCANNSNKSPPIFKGYFVSVFDEPSPGSSATELTNHERELMAEYQQREGVDLLEWHEQSLQMKSVSSADEIYEKAPAKHGDKVFQRFAKRLQLCPEQCIRYSWNGIPLFLTSPSEGGILPPCLSCGGHIVFELQLMPGLISILHDTTQPDVTIDFGVVMIYTCKESCWGDLSQTGQPLLREEHVVFQADPDSSLLTQATSLVLPNT